MMIVTMMMMMTTMMMATMTDQANEPISAITRVEGSPGPADFLIQFGDEDRNHSLRTGPPEDLVGDDRLEKATSQGD